MSDERPVRPSSSFIVHRSSLIAALIALSSRVIRQTMAPYFRQNQYYEGLDAAINELGRRIDPNFSPQTRSLPSSSAPRRRASGFALRDLISLLFLLFIFVVIIAPIMR